MNHIIRLEPGWRLVQPGEILQMGDERLTAGGWTVMLGCLGIRHSDGFFPVRRRTTK